MAAAFIAASLGLYYFYRETKALRKEVASLELSLRLSEANLRRAEQNNADLSAALSNEQGNNKQLSDALTSEQAKNSLFASQIQQISGTVGTLKKLSETDKELLNKYSKIYFLSENYVPAKLSAIPANYLYDASASQQFHGDALSFLERMLNEASSSNAGMQIISAYRSFYDQAAVKSGYKMLYGSGANQFSADQGYSEHQLGTAVDLTIPKLHGLSTQFDVQPAYKWLVDNAYRFGFVLSYPKENTYYMYEPWHWRFVGVALAIRLHDENKYFYDLPQRDIDAYLISIFD
ncbi:MAG: M15 family metallopeptidase [Candidatus Liptonbacteria bacterium]